MRYAEKSSRNGVSGNPSDDVFGGPGTTYVVPPMAYRTAYVDRPPRAGTPGVPGSGQRPRDGEEAA
jgi:hypothetical protein